MEKRKRTPTKSILFWLGASGNKILCEEMVILIIQELERCKINYQLALGLQDLKITDIYQRLWKNKIQTIDLDLKGLARYFSDYKCIIIPDTGPMHLVAALGIALVQVFVNSDMNQYGYTGSDKYVINKDLNVEPLLKFIQSYVS
jgi:ADP-heptose:LPS heptosyltransferase